MDFICFNPQIRTNEDGKSREPRGTLHIRSDADAYK